jgi:hypothetical protein
MTRPDIHPLWAIALLALLLNGCSMGQMVARTSVTMLDGGVEAMNRESDFELAREAIPANLKLMEGLLHKDPGNRALRQYAAEGFYGYAFGFIELEDPARAAEFYRRGYEHGREGLRRLGVELELEIASPDAIRAAVAPLRANAVPLLFWTASNWAKRIDLDRTDPAMIAQLAGSAALMERVMQLEPTYHHGSPDLFFAVYYGSRAPMFGGDYGRAARHFARANELNSDRLLLVDVLYAEYLARQRLDQEAFRQRLARVLVAPNGLLPEMELANIIAKRRAAWLLEQEEEWF